MFRYLFIASIVIGFEVLIVFNGNVRRCLYSIAIGKPHFVKSQAKSPLPTPSAAATPKVGGNDDSSPLFVLHIGPPKTGTSTIQAYATEYKELLAENNIYFLGHDSRHNETRLHELSKFCRKCDTVHLCSQCPGKWKAFERIVDQHYKLNHTAFVSDETFNRFFNDGESYERTQLWDRLEPILSRWRVRVILSYRRYFDWLPSTYHEFYNPNNKKQMDKWPGEGGAGVIPTFPEFLDRWTGEDNDRARGKQPLTIKKKWDEHFSNVVVLNMHQGDGLVQEFYCHMLPEATQLCDHIKTSTESLRKNPSSSKVVHYDMIAVAAYQNGLVDKRMARHRVSEAVRQKSAELGLLGETDFPLRCPTMRQTDLFLNTSLHLEAEIIAEHPQRKEEIKVQYMEALDTGKFCSVDTESVLKNETWQIFFRTLHPSLTQSKKSAQFDKANALQVNAKEDQEMKGSAVVDEASAATVKSLPMSRPSSMLCLYTGDEGSTVLSEALRLHPHVYSPSWAVEPANARYWRAEPFSLKSQIEAIRFLLRLPSNITVYRHRKKPMSLDEYKKKVGNAKATYIKVAVCKKLKNGEWEACMKEVVSNLFCGSNGEIVDHLILPVRYGFDRACSVFVHRDKELYKANSQFVFSPNQPKRGGLAELSEKDATVLRKAQQLYIRNFITLTDLLRTACPDQKKRPQILVFDYDTAKKVGIETTLEDVFKNLGLRNKAGDLNLGRFSQRKPGNYCNTMFNKKSTRILTNQKATYETWLNSTCAKGEGLPWCRNE